MLLYHGTHTGRLGAILQEGLKPRGTAKGNWERFPSRPDCVYLTDAYAPYFAMAGDLNPADYGGKMPIPALVEVDTDRLDTTRFCPDEDFLTQLVWTVKEQGQVGLLPAEIRKLLHGCRTMYELHNRIDPAAFKPMWKASLEALGNVAYFGSIAPEAITRYAQIDVAECRLIQRMAMEPTICTANYQFCAPQYRSLIAHIFDGDSVQIVADEAYAALHPEHREFIQRRKNEMDSQRERGVRVCWRS